MTHISPSAFSVPANNLVLTVLSATLPQPPRLHCHCKIIAHGDICLGLEIGSNHWGSDQVSMWDVSVLRSHTHV